MKKLKIGMNRKGIVEILGEPDAVNNGSEIFEGEGKIIGASSKLLSDSFFTDYCLWRRPEGLYELIIFHDKLIKITNAPTEMIETLVDSTMENETEYGVVLIIFAEKPTGDIEKASKKLIKDLKINLSQDAIMHIDISKMYAVDKNNESCVAFLTSRLLKFVDNSTKINRNQIEIDSAKLIRFQTDSNSPEWNAGVIYLVQKVN